MKNEGREPLPSRLANLANRSADKVVVFRVRSDPEPQHSIRRVNTDRAVIQVADRF